MYGRALYRGKWLSARQLGVQYQSEPISHTVRPSVTFKGRMGQPLRSGRIKCMSWNSGSGNAGLFDELEEYGCAENLDLICIQETRMTLESEWSTRNYHYIHSGKERAKGAGGILVMVSAKFARPSQIRCSFVVPGHLVHVKDTDGGYLCGSTRLLPA